MVPVLGATKATLPTASVVVQGDDGMNRFEETPAKINANEISFIFISKKRKQALEGVLLLAPAKRPKIVWNQKAINSISLK